MGLLFDSKVMVNQDRQVVRELVVTSPLCIFMRVGISFDKQVYLIRNISKII